MDGTRMETTPNYSDGNVGYDKGMEYQRWVKATYPRVYSGRELNYYDTRDDQYRKGETKEGVEVKFDDLIFFYCKTGRLYIETWERGEGEIYEGRPYVESGIWRQDNTTVWLQGDYDIWFLFSKAKLVWLEKLDPPFLFRPKPTPTSKGFCIPIKNAKILCLDYVEFQPEKTLF